VFRVWVGGIHTVGLVKKGRSACEASHPEILAALDSTRPFNLSHPTRDGARTSFKDPEMSGQEVLSVIGGISRDKHHVPNLAPSQGISVLWELAPGL
jgi:hypothetical protein